MERRYVLTKVGSGDYLLPSNDARKLWRIARYDEPTTASDLTHTVSVWGLWRWNGVVEPGSTPDPDDWEQWTMCASNLPRRNDAIAEAMRVG